MMPVSPLENLGPGQPFVSTAASPVPCTNVHSDVFVMEEGPGVHRACSVPGRAPVPRGDYRAQSGGEEGLEGTAWPVLG